MTSPVFPIICIPTFAATTVNDTAALNRDDFITITSAELHCSGKAYDNDGLWHILANGLPVDFAVAGETKPRLRWCSAPMMPVRSCRSPIPNGIA